MPGRDNATSFHNAHKGAAYFSSGPSGVHQVVPPTGKQMQKNALQSVLMGSLAERQVKD